MGLWPAPLSPAPGCGVRGHSTRTMSLSATCRKATILCNISIKAASKHDHPQVRGSLRAQLGGRLLVLCQLVADAAGLQLALLPRLPDHRAVLDNSADKRSAQDDPGAAIRAPHPHLQPLQPSRDPG